jgi:hypothetical protein
MGLFRTNPDGAKDFVQDIERTTYWRRPPDYVGILLAPIGPARIKTTRKICAPESNRGWS